MLIRKKIIGKKTNESLLSQSISNGTLISPSWYYSSRTTKGKKKEKKKKSYMVLVSSKTIILQTISRMWTVSFHHFTRLLLLHHSRDLHCHSRDRDLHCHSRDLHCQAEKNRQYIYYI